MEVRTQDYDRMRKAYLYFPLKDEMFQVHDVSAWEAVEVVNDSVRFQEFIIQVILWSLSENLIKRIVRLNDDYLV